MSQYIPKDGAGRMFDRRHDKSHHKSPDYAGLAQIEGKVYRVTGWYNPPSEAYRQSSIALRFELKSEFDRRMAERPAKPARTKRPRKKEKPDDRIPFDE